MKPNMQRVTKKFWHAVHVAAVIVPVVHKEKIPVGLPKKELYKRLEKLGYRWDKKLQLWRS